MHDMAEARKTAESAQSAQAAEDAKVRDSAKQDTSAVTALEDPLNPANVDGVRPATGTPKQVVEAGPGVEVDADLDQAEMQRAGSGDLDDASKDDLLTLARAKAPALTAEFVKQYGLTDEDLRMIARGEVSPPPVVGPIHNVDLHRTPGGWQITPVGVPPEDAGKNAISR
jgi:hypothetical protein